MSEIINPPIKHKYQKNKNSEYSNHNLDPYHIDDYKPLRNSKLWTLQQNYFKTKGISAWQGEVPFYISTNAFIARQYAQLVRTMIQDSIAIEPDLKTETFYILELGAGLGKFSFYFLKAFFTVEHPKNPIKIRYIMSDVAEKNKNFWKENGCLQPFIDAGHLELAILDIAEYTNNNEVFSILEKKSNKSPLIIIANYVFDCIKQDAFIIQDKKLHEVQFQIKSTHKNYDQLKSENLRSLKFDFLINPNSIYNSNPISSPTSHNELIINQILKQYTDILADSDTSVFSLPLGAIDFLNEIEKLTNNNYFLIAGDKGIAQMDKWNNFELKELFSYDGCYAFMMNFDILGRYIQAKGGDSLLSHNTNSFKICLYHSKYSFSVLPNTTELFLNYFESYSADEFCYSIEAVRPHFYGFSLKALIGYLRLSCWDMDVYQDIHDRLVELVCYKEIDLSSNLVDDLKRVEEYVYYYPGSANIYNQLGIVYQSIGQATQAIRLYKKALLVWGETTEPHHNLGMVYDALKDENAAIYHYKKAIELNRYKKINDHYARRRLSVLSGQLSTDLLKILGRIAFVFGMSALLLYYIIRVI